MMPRSLCYDRAGNPIDHERFSELIRDDAYRQVALDDVGGVRVSTIWLGVDHGGYRNDDPPVIFETMVYAVDDAGFTSFGEWQRRYHTETEALEAHAELVRRMRALPAGAVRGLLDEF